MSIDSNSNVMRHEYRELDEHEQAVMQQIKDRGRDFCALVESIGTTRELSLAKTKMEEAVFWAVKGLTG